MKKNSKWWGNFRFNKDEIKSWRMGDRLIAIKRCEHEWIIWNHETQTESTEPLVLDKPKTESCFGDFKFSRHIIHDSIDELLVEPSLADRAVIARPSAPLNIMPGESVEIFVSTPLWFTILLPNKSLPIADFPFWRPSDTWFGPNTLRGDLCYSKFTDAKIHLDKLVKRPNRAITSVTIQNDDEQPLIIDRINIPVPVLHVYADAENHMWTDNIHISQTLEHGKAVSGLKHFAPSNKQDLRLVSDSRETSAKSSFLSSIKNLVS